MFDFQQNMGEVHVVGWGQMLAALKTLVLPYLLSRKDVIAKLGRLWAYEIKHREGGNAQSVFAFSFCVLNFLTLLRSPVDNTNSDAKRARGREALLGDQSASHAVAFPEQKPNSAADHPGRNADAAG